MNNTLNELLVNDGFRLAEKHERYLVFNFPPEEEDEAPNQVINLILSKNGSREKLMIALHSAKLCFPNAILLESNQVFSLLHGSLQHNETLASIGFVAEESLLKQIPSLLACSFLSQLETRWSACVTCGRQWPNGALGQRPHPIFNPNINRLTGVECDACARNAVGLRFG